MRQDARANAAISILDNFLVGQNLNSILLRWAKNNRYAGSSDREAIRNIVFDVLRVKKTLTSVLEKEKQPINGRALVFLYSVFYALNLNGKISIRRLQFLELPKKTVVHIISDNKKYRDDEIDFFELIPMIYGEVVWRSNNFKDIEFLKHNISEPNLFLSKEFLETDKKEIA